MPRSKHAERAVLKAVKARLLPPHWLEAGAEWLIEQLPRQFLRVTSTPLKQLAAFPDAGDCWLSEGSEPLFSWRVEPIWERGWYYLEMALVRHNGSRYARLQFAGGTDEEWASVPVSTNFRGSVREVFFLPHATDHLRWQPTAAQGMLIQSPLALHRITHLESIFRRAYRVVLDRKRLQHLAAAEPRQLNAPNVVSRLQAAYNAGTQLRLQRLHGLNYEALRAILAQRERQRFAGAQAALKVIAQQHVIVLVPIARAARPALLGLIASLQAQSHAHWQLILIGPNTPPADPALLSGLPVDKRIQYFSWPADTSSLAAGLNQAVQASDGTLVVCLEMGAILSPDCLRHFLLEFVEHPAAQVAYCDEDTLQVVGNGRSEPLFKPDWNPELLTAFNYFGGCVVFSKTGLHQNGGFREGYEGAEIYDLILRMTLNRSADAVRHLPYVLCHRQAPQPTLPTAEPCSSHRAEQRALENLLAPHGRTVSPGSRTNLHHVSYPLPCPAPLVSIIVPTRDRVKVLAACVASVLEKTTYPHWEMIIVDNDSSTSETLEFLTTIQADPRIIVMPVPGAFNYSRLNNEAAQRSRGSVLVLLNNDTEVIATDWLEQLISHALRPDVGAVGAKLLYPDHTIQHAGVALGMGGVAGHVLRFLPASAPGYLNRAVVTQEVSAVTGACLAVSKTNFELVGGLEEELAVALNDIDFCLKLGRQGLRNIFEPRALLYHHESLSRGLNDTPAKTALWEFEFGYMKTKWANWLARDPNWPIHDELLLAAGSSLAEP